LLTTPILINNPGSQSTTQRANGGDVFIVDKDVHLRKLLTEFLGVLECRLCFFDDGYTALDEARRNPPKLIITEILVPKLDGLALCRLIKGDPSLASVKVLVLTFLSAGDRARLSRADGFIQKPIQRPSILQSVRALIGAPTAELKS
ncbi:MAG: Sensor protein, partial [Verrucomicrobiales bacterium]|nr:Sensor protein [Verrucomicrobiales bacterium]